MLYLLFHQKAFIPVKAQETQEDNNNSGNCNFSCFK